MIFIAYNELDFITMFVNPFARAKRRPWKRTQSLAVKMVQSCKGLAYPIIKQLLCLLMQPPQVALESTLDRAPSQLTLTQPSRGGF